MVEQSVEIDCFAFIISSLLKKVLKSQTSEQITAMEKFICINTLTVQHIFPRAY